MSLERDIDAMIKWIEAGCPEDPVEPGCGYGLTLNTLGAAKRRIEYLEMEVENFKAQAGKALRRLGGVVSKMRILAVRHTSPIDRLFFVPDYVTEKALQDALRDWIALAQEMNGV